MDQQAIDTAVKRAREVMDGFIAAFNAEDADAMRRRWFNFPHVRFHSGRVTIMERPEDFRSTVWERTGEAKGWARTAWDYVDLAEWTLGHSRAIKLGGCGMIRDPLLRSLVPSLARFDRFRMSAIRSLLGANRTSTQSQNGANDPSETWATKEFCSAKALFIPLRQA